jgi:hypothetical protein
VFFPRLLLAAEDLAEHYVEVIEALGAVPCEAGAVHDGERFGVQIGELFQVLPSEWCVGNILREDARLKILHRLTRAAHDIGSGERFDVAHVMEQVRTEQRLLGLFEEDAGVPAVGRWGVWQ